MIVRALILAGFAALAPSRHEIHSTLTVVRVERAAVDFRIRAFADDLSAAVAQMHGRQAPADSSVVPDELDRYVRANVRATDTEARVLPLEPCGVERAGEAYLLCYRISGAASRRVAQIGNLMLTERHKDQVNVVQFVVGASRRSVLLTRDSAPAPVPGR